MRDLLLALLHLAVVTAKLCGSGGVRAVMAENLLLKQQLIVLRRARRRAPNLTPSDRLLCGFWSVFLSPGRLRKVAVALRPRRSWCFIKPWSVASTAGFFIDAAPKKPGPKGPSQALIQTIVELKSRNPRFGCPRIAHIVSRTFGIDIDKNVVYRVLAKHDRAAPGGTGPSWLAFIGHTTDSLWKVDLFRCESIGAPELLGARGHGPVHASPGRLRRAWRRGHGHRRLPPVQRRHSRAGRPATSQYGSRSAVRSAPGAGRGPCSERPNARCADRLGALRVHWQRSSV